MWGTLIQPGDVAARRYAAGALVSAAMWLTGAPPLHAQAADRAQAPDRYLSLEFEAYVGGISALTVGVEAGLNPRAYTIDFRFGTRGVVSWVVDWSMKSYSRGIRQDGRLVPATAGADSLWNGRYRTTRISYRDDGSVEVDLVPPRKDDDPKPVPEDMKRGATDLSTAILSALNRVDRTDSCPQRASVYDGRRRYDMVFADLGKGMLGPDAPAVYHGPTLRCKLWIEPLAGFREQKSRVGWATGEEAVVHIARVFQGAPPVPVAIEYETGLGLLRAYLTEAAFSSDGERQRLARNAPGDKNKIRTDAASPAPTSEN